MDIRVDKRPTKSSEDMFDIPYPNTRYAEALDYEQQIEYEEELAGEYVTIEEQEERAFSQRCKQSKISATRLKKYEVELRNIQRKADKELSELERQARTTKSSKQRQSILSKQRTIRKQLEADEKALRDKYFFRKKRKQ